MTDFAARERRRIRREHRRTVAAWAVFGVVSAGLHHLSLQGLDVAGLGVPGGRDDRTVMLDLFEPAPVVKPTVPPTAQAGPAKPPNPAAEAPAAEPPKPEEPPGEPRERPPRPRRPRAPRLPQATESEEDRGALTLSSDYGESYDPLNPRLRMSDWASGEFAAADRFFDATEADRARGLAPTGLRSPFESIGPWNDWGGDAAVAAASDFFAGASDGIQLAINPDRPDILRYVPVDASVLAYVNLRAIQGGPHAEGVAALLRRLPDYQSMVGQIEAEVLEHADELYVTSSNPADRSKTVVIVRHHLAEEDLARLIMRQIALAGGKADWSLLSNRAAVTVDRDHAALTPWLYLFPERGVVLVLHRSNVGPVVAALQGHVGRGDQPQLVWQIRRLVGDLDPEPAAAPETAPEEPPTLFAIADSGTLDPHLRFFTRTLAGTDLGEFDAGYLRITGGAQPQVLGGLRLAEPDAAPRWAELLRRIERQELAKTFGFAWAGRDDRIFFRFGLTDPVVDSSLGVFRVWADRYYASDAVPPLPEAPALPGTVVAADTRPAGTTDAADDAGTDADRRKDDPDGGADLPKHEDAAEGPDAG